MPNRFTRADAAQNILGPMPRYEQPTKKGGCRVGGRRNWRAVRGRVLTREQEGLFRKFNFVKFPSQYSFARIDRLGPRGSVMDE